MKTKISHLGRSTVSVILAVMMLLSTMLIGTVSTVNAVTSITSDGSAVFYFNPNPKGADTWSQAGAKLYVYFFNDSNGKEWSNEATVLDNSHAYVKIPSGTFTNFILARMNPNPDAKENPDWVNKWGQTKDISISKLNGNYVSDFNYDSDSIASSNYIQTSTAKLDADSAKVKEGTAVTFTPSLTSNTDFNDIKSVSYSVKKDSVDALSSDYSIEGSKITFNKAGNYEVTANVIYNAKGFSDITKTATATTTVTVESSQTPVAGSVSLTASPETVTSGGSTTLTATLKNKAESVGNVTYTFKKADGTEVGTVTDSPNDTAFVNVENITSDTTYTVTVSAAEHSDVTDTATVTVKQLENWYLMGSVYGSWNDLNNTKYRLNYDSATGCYYYDTTLINTNVVYFRFHNGTSQFSPATNNEEITLDVNKHSIAKTNDSNNAFKYSNPVSNYRIWLDSSNASDIKVWIADTAQKHNITNNSGKDLTISPSQASAGETVTVKATPGTGEVLKSVTVVGANNTQVTTTVSGNTATFVMPDHDVIVTNVTFREAYKYTVNFSSSDPTNGKVSAQYNGADFATGTKVTEGDTVTFTATPISSGYTFKDWTVTVNNTPQTYTGSSLPLKITANTTVTANFNTGTPSGYYLLCCENTGENVKFKEYTTVPLIDKGNGEYYADFNVANIPKEKEYYIIFSEKEDTYGVINDIGGVTVNIVNKNGFSFEKCNYDVQKPNNNNNNVGFAKVYIGSDSTVTGFTVKISNLNIKDKKITYDAVPKFYEAPANTVEITAKDGTIRDGFTNTEKGKTTAVLGDTTLSIKTPDNTEIAVSNLYKIDGENRAVTAKNVPKGSTVTVTTTIKPNATFAGHNGSDYYVKGFVVNGESYGIQSGPNETGAYTLKYQIPDDVADGTNFEITPVYFLKNSSNCVTFYVEGFDGDIQKSWGNTIACYPYYEGVADKDNAFGAYPGQPLLYEGGKYYTQIPKSIILDGDEKKIVGMTLNNFALETVHGAISTIKENKQSYDYDDFVRIANNNYGDNIIFTFKYSTAYDNFGENPVSDDTIKEADFGNGWEDLTDYNHSKVDLFGNVLTGDNLNKEPLLVVSNGYFENYQGFYATEWTVYEKLKDGTYSKIAQIPSSALLLKSKEDLINSTSDPKYKNALKDYADAYGKLDDYKYIPAKITFEKSITKGFSLQGNSNSQGGESAERVDGRWYYSKMGEKITAKIAVEYGDIATSSFTNDPFEVDTNITTTIGAHAYFTNEAAYGKTTCKSNIDSSKYFTFTADTIATVEGGQNYVFLGWYLLSDNKYTKLTDAKAPMTGSDTFVARYVKAPAGTVTIDHKLFSAASNPTPTPTPGTGSGKCYVTVKVLDKDDKLIKEFAETENSVTLDKTYIDSSKNYKLEITLRTVTSGKDEFQKFYYLKQDKKSYVPIESSTTTTGNETKVTRMVDIRENFFKRNDDGTYSFRNETGSDSIHYYSDIKETKIPYKITFNYKPRLESDAKQYVVTGEFTSEYILKNGAVLTKEFVMSVAPYEDNFFNTIKWNKDKIVIDNKDTTKTAVVNSATSPRTVTVTALNPDGTLIEAYVLDDKPEFAPTVVYGDHLTYKNLCELTEDQKTEIANGKEYIYVANSEYKGEKFSYWQISTSSDMNNKSAYVTKCFSREFNYIAYNNYYIWPVYGDSQPITGASTTLNFLDYSRNQSTDLEGGSKTDRVFADFALAFDSNGIQLQTYKGNDIKVGMFLEVCGDLETDSTGNVITDIEQYKGKSKYSTSDADLERIKTAILNNRDKKNFTYTTADGKERKLLNKPIDIKSLDNKNRIEYYVGYNNNDNNQKKLMRAYSYVIVGDEITLCSTPYSFVNYYNVGNKTYTVS